MPDHKADNTFYNTVAYGNIVLKWGMDYLDTFTNPDVSPSDRIKGIETLFASLEQYGAVDAPIPVFQQAKLFLKDLEGETFKLTPASFEPAFLLEGDDTCSWVCINPQWVEWALERGLQYPNKDLQIRHLIRGGVNEKILPEGKQSDYTFEILVSPAGHYDVFITRTGYSELKDRVNKLLVQGNENSDR